MREDFREHNFIWTQWKKPGHFRVLKQLPSTAEPSENISNKWRCYCKIEANYHLSNKFALFHNMSKYYKSQGRDPFEVLPLTFHIK